MAISPYLAGQLLKFARAVVDTFRDRANRQYPPASRPGQYPAKRTGNLRRFTESRPMSVAQIAATGQVRVGHMERAFYGVILEYDMDRKGLGAAVAEVIKTRVKGGKLPAGIRWTRTRDTLKG